MSRLFPNRPLSDGGIAVEDLGQEQGDEGDGVEETVAPSVFDVAAGVEDLGAVELLGRSFLEPAQDADDSVMHGVLLSGGPDNPLTRRGGILFKLLPG